MNVIEYVGSLTGIIFDEAVIKRIVLDRCVDQCCSAELLSRRMKDLLLADLLMTAYRSPNNIASQQHQHGQFSTSIGQQRLDNRDQLYAEAVRLYKKWGEWDDDSAPETSLVWME